jgi:hypothetical protein
LLKQQVIYSELAKTDLWLDTKTGF